MFKYAIIFLLVIVLCGCFLAFGRIVYSKESDPTGDYTAIVSYEAYLSFVTMSPGSSGDKAGFVKIINNNGDNLGEMPVEMLQLSRVMWSKNGARIPMIGEWNFKKGTCYYWSKDGSTKILC
ncbi:hypothetical protein [Marinobacter xestospongiae]|uniref:hypothetical protein n=1 Tax=Marinobacter xestospongiae TaxID=994319 RepID=UPI0020062526|nr:hypothetical protein [Marinobacter xestospongiae]MCK7569000.1 hypothetical protein [Marinobacter xestospongiae]